MGTFMGVSVGSVISFTPLVYPDCWMGSCHTSWWV